MSECQKNQFSEKNPLNQSDSTLQNIVKKLSAWFLANARNLPWRVEYSPYQILISEMMLQQTQINTALSYYQNWLIEFPDIKTLANAPIEKIMNQWQGLGYYSRARNLHRLAKIVCQDHGGKLPEKYHHLIALPGIGPYSAGAISSIAFKQKVPAIDGNVRRVFARLFAFDQPINQSRSEHFFRIQALDLLEFAKPRIFNQALMELGALICLPKKPKCFSCPIEKECLSYQINKVDDYPVVKKTKLHQSTILFFFTTNKANQIALVLGEPMAKNKKKNSSQVQSNWWQGLYSLPYQRFSQFKKIDEIIDPLKKNSAQSMQLVDQNQFAISNHKVRSYLLAVSEDFLISQLKDEVNINFFSFSEIANLPLSSQSKKLLKLASQRSIRVN